jgi:hypothetical protein
LFFPKPALGFKKLPADAAEISVSFRLTGGEEGKV